MDILQEAKNLFIQGSYKQAESLLNQLILQGQQQAEIYHMLAVIHYDRGQFSKAVKFFKRALEIDPSFTDASLGLAILLNDLGRYEQAREVFLQAQETLEQKTQRLDPYWDEKIASKHLELADLYLMVKRPKEALEQLLKAQKLSSRKAELSLRIADCYWQLSQPEKAVATLKQVIREFPNLLAARFQLAQIYYQLGQVAEAVNVWESILMRDPQNEMAQKMIQMAQAVGITWVDKVTSPNR